MKDLIYKGLGLTIVVALILLTAFAIIWNTQRVQGSVEVTNEYLSTSTSATWSTATTQCKDTLTNYKTLGSVIVTKTTNATLFIYDATSTTHSDFATTTIAAFPLTTVGQYTFDVALKRGLCVVVDTTVGVASSTVTFR